MVWHQHTSASKQRTILEALKIKERDRRVTQYLGFYQNKQVVENFKEDVMQYAEFHANCCLKEKEKRESASVI